MEIMSPQNTRVKEWAGLQEKKHRDRSGKYIVEGIHLVQEALQAEVDVECLAYDLDKGMPSELKPLLQAVQGMEVIGVSAAVVAMQQHGHPAAGVRHCAEGAEGDRGHSGEAGQPGYGAGRGPGPR